MEDDRGRGGNRQRYPSNKQVYEPSAQNPSCSYSNQSTLRKTKQEEKDFTTVVFNFCDEQYPYRTKIPGRNVTLKQFKEILHKKGSYRYVQNQKLPYFSSLNFLEIFLNIKIYIFNIETFSYQFYIDHKVRVATQPVKSGESQDKFKTGENRKNVGR